MGGNMNRRPSLKLDNYRQSAITRCFCDAWQWWQARRQTTHRQQLG